MKETTENQTTTEEDTTLGMQLHHQTAERAFERSSKGWNSKYRKDVERADIVPKVDST